MKKVEKVNICVKKAVICEDVCGVIKDERCEDLMCEFVCANVLSTLQRER
jgi:hypothetical protein